jgi:hypothetical protein
MDCSCLKGTRSGFSLQSFLFQKLCPDFIDLRLCLFQGTGIVHDDVGEVNLVLDGHLGIDPLDRLFGTVAVSQDEAANLFLRRNIDQQDHVIILLLPQFDEQWKIRNDDGIGSNTADLLNAAPPGLENRRMNDLIELLQLSAVGKNQSPQAGPVYGTVFPKNVRTEGIDDSPPGSLSGSSTSWARRSKSMMNAPFPSSIWATVDFPQEMLPVKPTFNMAPLLPQGTPSGNENLVLP